LPRRRTERTETRHQPHRSSSGNPLALWKEARDPRGTVVETYLRGRGLELPDDIAGRVVRYHPYCPFGPGVRKPCMIAAFRSIADDKLVAIQRTALTLEGEKIGRMMMGPVAGAAIKIDADENVEHGSARVLKAASRRTSSASAQCERSARPVRPAPFLCLAASTASQYFTETDDGGANAEATRTCGTRWAASGREVLPRPVAGGDANGALQQQR